MIDFLLYAAAAVCFVLATIGATARVNLVALGLFLWVLVSVLGSIPK